MSKKVVMMLLTMAMSAMTLVGCGKSDYGNPPGLAYDAGVAESFKDDLVGDGNLAEIDETSNNLEDEVVEAEGDDTEFGRPPEEDLVPWDEMGSEGVDGETGSETGEAKGIIMLQVDWKSNTFAPSFVVNAVDADTGDYHTVSSFTFEHVARVQENEFLIEPAYELSRYSNYRDMFNEDFTLMAATKTFLANEEKHAGWVDQSGEFFDLTIALNEQAQSDFDTAKQYKSAGFTTDGNFVYADVKDPHNPIYYMVPLNKIGPDASFRVDGGHPYIMDIHSDAWDWTRGYFVSSWINEGQFLATGAVDGDVTCWYANIAAKSINQIVPTGSQTSWGPVIGPDGASVAFLSAPNQGTDSPSIYITDVNGEGNPVKLETSYLPLSGRYAEHGDILQVISIGYHYASVLEWR